MEAYRSTRSIHIVTCDPIAVKNLSFIGTLLSWCQIEHFIVVIAQDLAWCAEYIDRDDRIAMPTSHHQSRRIARRQSRPALLEERIHVFLGLNKA